MNQAYLFNNGINYQSYRLLGSRPDNGPEGEPGYRFAVWAPNAAAVSVVGDFNEWDHALHPLRPYGTTGIWTGFIPDLTQWMRYKYAIRTGQGDWILKADPFARHSETRPGTASILYDPDDYTWNDAEWLKQRSHALDAQPLNIYEVHLGSWRRYPDGETFDYRHLADELAPYVKELGFNAIEVMPVSEYPLDASWGYQVTGYYSVTSRYGTPADFKYFVDTMHRHGIRVILDWVPAHFPRDAFGLARFDGEPLYEYADTRKGEQRSWGTLVFDFEKLEVVSFLISNAWFWLEEFHIDGLRVDAVSSMLYLNFGREEGEAVTNKYGGYGNLEAVEFVKHLNSIIRKSFPGVMMFAEESTDWPYVTRAPEDGGLGFTHKWNMGWMNDTLKYMSLDYLYRRHHHQQLTFSMMYAFSENYVLPFSHDEVVHGKMSLLGRMPGDQWRQFASLRTLYMYQIVHPGAKLNFMGNEFAPFIEWRYYEELEWFLLQYDNHRFMQQFVGMLNHLYLESPELWEDDRSWHGFRWMQADDYLNSVIACSRHTKDNQRVLLAVLNLTPAVHEIYKVPVPEEGVWRLIVNSDEPKYGGSGYLGAVSEGQTYRAVREPLPGAAPAAGTADADAGSVTDQGEAAPPPATETDASPERTPAVKLGDPTITLKVPPLCGLYFILERDPNPN